MNATVIGRLGVLLVAVCFPGFFSPGEVGAEPAVITVTDEVAAEDVEPLGANLGTIAGGTNFAVNNHVWHSGFEPIVYRKLVRVEQAEDNWFFWSEFGGISNWSLLWTGFGNGAHVRFYRIVDKSGNPIPYKEGLHDIAGADHVVFLGDDTVPEPSDIFPQGGWIANRYVQMQGEVRGSLRVTDVQSIKNGETWYYVVRAVDSEGKESGNSPEAAASPKEGIDNGPRIFYPERKPLPRAEAGKQFKEGWRDGYDLEVTGAKDPVVWSVIEGALPAGLQLDSKTGKISGAPSETPGPTPFTVQVKDSLARTDTLKLVLNPAKPERDGKGPEAPVSLTATANNGSVTLSWTASSSPDVVGYRIYRSDTPSAQQQERVYISKGGLGLRNGDYAVIMLKKNFIPRSTSAPHLRKYYNGDKGGFSSNWSNNWSARCVPHPGTVPEVFKEPGESCLEITPHSSEGFLIGEYVYHKFDSGEGQWYSQLHPGAAYRIEGWFRQEGLGNGGKVRFMFTGEYSSLSSEPFAVTGEWKKFSHEFTAPGYPAKGGHIMHGISFTGPGKLWMDNFVLYRNDEKHGHRPFTPHEVSFDEFMDSIPATGKKPAIRFYNLSYHHALATSMFGNYPNQSYNISWDSGVGGQPKATFHQCFEYALATGDTPATRCVPYLTVAEEYSEAEWKAIVEYVGVPYDPASDTPDSKPHAYKRYIMRGKNGTPWTDEFREVLIEFGNETWHNGAGGYGWDGFGRPGWVHKGGVEYGMFARYMFNETVMKMPEWDKYDLGKKIKFTLGGNYTTSLSDGYVELALQQKPSVAYAGHANYVGTKWETNDSGSKSFNDRGVQKTLIGMHTAMKKIISGAADSKNRLNAKGIDYRVIAYEGGPSGYWTNRNNPVVDEKYGKSVAMGLAALDAWLYSSLNGYGHQCYLGFNSGKWWSSHTLPEAGGYRAHCGWLALRMRNRFARGDTMVKTSIAGAPTISKEGEDVPLLSSYALRDRNSYSVFVLCRKLDSAIPVAINLPFDSVHSIDLHRLAHPDGSPADPRESNLDEQKVSIVSSRIDTAHFSKTFRINENTGGVKGGIPAGGIYLYVFTLKDPDSLTPKI